MDSGSSALIMASKKPNKPIKSPLRYDQGHESGQSEIVELLRTGLTFSDSRKRHPKHVDGFTDNERPLEALPQFPAGMSLHYVLGGSIADARDFGPDHEYPSASRLASIVIALCLSVFCMSLDNTIIATAIPVITGQFNSIDDVGWYGSAYLLTTCAFQLFFGKLYKFFPIKWVYLTAILIFEIGSVICGAARNSEALIIGRAIAGLGSAGIFSGAILITAHTVPLRRRPIFTGIVDSMYGIASIGGPLIGGAFTDKISWRWCFYINLPIGVVTVIFILLFFESPKVKAQELPTWLDLLRQLDVGGLCVFIPALICVLMALQWGGAQYSWSNWRLILLWVAAILLCLAFVAVQLCMGRDATIPAYLVKQRTVTSAACFAACLGGSFYALIYTLPIWFQVIKGASATQSGIMNLPTLIAMILFSIISGGCVSKIGYYTPFCIASAIFMSVGSGLLTLWRTDTGHAQWIGYQVMYGIGVGMGFQQPLIAVQTTLPPEDVAMGTALVIFSQSLGGAIFLSAAQNVFLTQLIQQLVRLVPGLTSAQIVATGAVDVAKLIPPEYLVRVLEAYNVALTRTFFTGVGAACATIVPALLIEWKSVKSQEAQSDQIQK